MPASDNILRLVERFERNREDYRRGRYNETQLRREFLDPLFIELGWDVYNAEGCAEAYKDVIHEDAIRIGPSVNAPDYCFRIGGTRKFFVEAKKPSTDIRDDPHPAYQLRRYAWSAKLPLSILSDFEEFAVYDCRVRPKPTDKASAARILYITFDEYPHRWDEIAGVFSKQAVRQGSFDRFAESKKKRGTAEVDDAFLAEIETWRDALARNIALRNPDLSNRQLNFAVQRTIDRIIFLRIAEDRGLERHGELMALTSGPDVYARLLALFRRADDRYNSGLFHFEREKDRHTPPDELTPVLSIDDKPLKDIFKSLYYPQSPYEFSVLPVEILGQVYERFLGKVITLTPGHRAKIEDKPEVKKAGGVYYTPAYIVDYIVEHTVGELLKTRHVESFKTRPPRMNEPLTVLDPACGSGSFLLGAYQRLLDWHLKYYTENDPDTWLAAKYPPIVETTSPAAPEVPEGRVGRAHAVEAGEVTEGAPARAHAVEAGEVTEGAPARAHAVHDAGAGDPLAHADGNDASGPAAPRSFKLTVAERKRILLDHVYGVDIDPQAVEVTKLSLLLKVLEGEKQLLLFATERALPDLADNIKCGNSLIGPDFYQGRQALLFDEDQRLKINAFDWNAEFADIMTRGGFDAVIGNPPYIFGEYHIGVMKSYFEQHFVLANRQYDVYWLFIERGMHLTRKEGRFSLIVPDALLARDECSDVRDLLLRAGLESVYHCGLVFSAGVSAVVFVAAKTDGLARVNVYTRQDYSACFQYDCAMARFVTDQKKRLLVHATDRENELLERLSSGGLTLAHAISISRGEETGKKHVQPTGPIPILVGEDIGRYSLKTPSRYVQELRKRSELYRPPKIIMIKTGATCIATLEEAGVATMQSVYNLHSKDTGIGLPLILAIVNSNLIRWYIAKVFTAYKLLFPQLNQKTVEDIPLPLEKDALPARKQALEELVRGMLSLHSELADARTPAERTAIERQITATDQAIDQLVYKLYGLTDEEIRIVEEAEK